MTITSRVKLAVEGQTDMVYVLPLPTTVPFFFHWYVAGLQPEEMFAVHVLLLQPGPVKYSKLVPVIVTVHDTGGQEELVPLVE